MTKVLAYRGLLEKADLQTKSFLVKAGGTHTGIGQKRYPSATCLSDRTAAGEHLIKRAVYHVANGVKLIFWGTNQGKRRYKKKEKVSLIILVLSTTASQKQENVTQKSSYLVLIRDGIKKLSYYTKKNG